jgi:hypothetical protein
MRTKFRREHGRTEVFEQATLCDQVANVWNVVKNYGFGGQQSCRKTRKSRVFGSADTDRTSRWFAAANEKLVHKYL